MRNREHNDLQGWLTPKEVGDKFGVAAKSILRWSRDGRLPRPVRLGRQVLYYWPLVLDFLRAKSGYMGPPPQETAPPTPKYRMPWEQQ